VPPPQWVAFATNFEKLLLKGATPDCNPWDSHSQFEDTNRNGTVTYFGSATRNVSATSEFFIRSNTSYSFATGELNQGNFLVTMNPDETVTHAVLKWNLETPDPSGLSSVCFSTLTNNGTMLDIQSPSSTQYNYKYSVTLMFPQNSTQYTVPSLSVNLPYFSLTFEKLDVGPFFNNVNVQGSSAHTRFGYLHARNAIIKLGVGQIWGIFEISNSLSLDTMDSGINATVTLANEDALSSLSISTANGPIDSTVTLVSRYSSSSSVPSYLTSFKTTNAPLTTRIQYAPSLLSASLQVRASTQLAPAYVIVDDKYEGTYDLHSYLGAAYLVDKRSTDPTKQKRPRGLAQDTNTTSAATGWIGWSAKRPSSSSPGQGSIIVDSVRDNAGCKIRQL